MDKASQRIAELEQCNDRLITQNTWLECRVRELNAAVYGGQSVVDPAKVVYSLVDALHAAQRSIDKMRADRDRQTLTFGRLQAEHKPWVERNFAGREPYHPLLGAIEELGELAHAHLKALQGIRGSAEEHHAAKVDAIGDVVIFLADYCTANGIDFQEAVERTWATVKQRDWKADPENGSGKEVE